MRITARRTVFILCAGLVLHQSALAQSASVGEPGRDANAPNPLKNVYFGEEHMHTRNSFDAFTVGVKQTWEDAYRFAMGEEIALSTTGEKMKRWTPYDFVAITDHSEYYGVLKDLVDAKSPLSQSDFAKGFAKARTDPAAAKAAVTRLIPSTTSSGRTGASPTRRRGKLPPVGNTVDVAKATYTNDIGDTQLSAVWMDPDFDPTRPERAWSSPIWYTPPKAKEKLGLATQSDKTVHIQ